MYASDMTPADIAACTGNRRDGDGYGWNNGLEWIIILMLFGWGRNGFGGLGAGNGAPCATQADVRSAVDQQTLINKLDNQTYGLADSTYALNNAITSGFYGAELSRCNQQAALMAQLNAMMMADQRCCCETQRMVERGFADTNYNIATQACDTRNLINNVARDIIDNQNNNARMYYDMAMAQRLADKDDKIAARDAKVAEQAQTIFTLQLAASQAAQNNYLVNQLKPCPVPAYITCNPWAASYGYGQPSCNTCCQGNMGYAA